MKKRSKFDIEKAVYAKNPVYFYGLLDPYTVKIARFMYNLGFSANVITMLNFIMGMGAIVIILIMRNYMGLVISAILITLRNLGDTIDGKIARGSNTVSKIGGFADIISDWVIFHPAFFIAIGYLTNNVSVGFLCVTGYMSREFTRRIFEKTYEKKATQTKESKKISWIVSIATKYDLATVFIFLPIFLLINKPALIIYTVAIIEYTLLFGEFAFDFFCLWKKKKRSIINERVLEEKERII